MENWTDPFCPPNQALTWKIGLTPFAPWKIGLTPFAPPFCPPFADGNGRTGRALALWDLYRRGFDSHYLFSVDEYYWENRPAYYAALSQVRDAGEDLTEWLEYCARGLKSTSERVWLRLKKFQAAGSAKMTLAPRQEHLLGLLRDHGSLSPSEIWEHLDVSRQGAMNIISPLIKAGLIEKRGTQKSGRYYLTQQ